MMKMDKPSKKNFLVAFKQDTSVGIECYIPLGIVGSYEIIREGLTKKEDVSALKEGEPDES